MTTVRDGVGATAAPAIPTMLPTTCGEETGLPGVPRVGCVATVSYHPKTPHGFSASMIATADSVAILGPDLDQRRRGLHCLFTRHLWRSASLVECAGAGGQSIGAVHHVSVTPSSPSSLLTAATTAGMLSHADGSGVNIIALTACSLASPYSPDDASPREPLQEQQRQQQRKSAMSDAVAVTVAWADVALQHHVTVLVLHLKRVLSPSWTGYPDGSLLRVVEQDVFSLLPSQSVLRLFYHPAMTALPAQAFNDADGDISTSSRQVIMCSLFSPSSSFSHGGKNTHTDGSGSTVGVNVPSNGTVRHILKKANAAMLNSSGGGTAERTTSSVSPNATATAKPRRRGQLCFLTVSAEVSNDPLSCDDEENKELIVTAKSSTPSDVAAWLQAFQIDRVVCAFTVQSTSTRMIAAAGTTDGRIFALGPTSTRLVCRVSGPVADAMFVRTKPAKAEMTSRNVIVDEILNEAIAEDALKNGSFTNPSDIEVARHDSDFTALVVLDSAGHLLVLRAVNSGAPITQIVPDLPQIITLANGQKQTLTFVSPPTANLEMQISSKDFLDLSSLRHFIGRRRTAPPPSHRVSNVPLQSNPPLASSSLTATPSNRSFAGASSDEPLLSGHILSRGLLCVTNIEWGKGGSELVVSTMGQAVVSVPFIPTEGCFRIAGFTVTPAPMFYVGVVDFFADSNPTLVMAGLKNVLVARRPQSTVRERAQLLLRLLSKKEREQRHSDSDDGVEG